MKRRSGAGRFAERELHGIGDLGDDEHIAIWIDRRPGGVWAVGRSVDAHLRETDDERPEDTLFEGYELDDALARANEALEDEVRVLEEEGRAVDAKPFTRKEVLPALERWFFGR